jgi:enoyl-CoA hydratase/carnithine racemase
VPWRASAKFTDEWENFSFDIADGVATIMFDRADVLNALTFDVYADLRDALAQLPHRNDVRAVIITGKGRGFCSGGDVHKIIGALREMGTKQLLEFARMTGDVVTNMRSCPLPIIAAVNGIAAGAGAVIALAADLRVAARSATFSFLFTKVGLAGADMGSAYLLPRVVGLGRATELLMLGESVGADDAVAMGLASRAVPDEELMDEARALAQGFAEGPGLAYASTKMLLAREQDMDLAGALELEAATQALLMTSEDHSEFYDAFRSKRPPKWKGQ